MSLDFVPMASTNEGIARRNFVVLNASKHVGFGKNIGNLVALELLNQKMQNVFVRVGLFDETVPRDLEAKQSENFNVSYEDVTESEQLMKIFETPVECCVIIVPFEQDAMKFINKVLPAAEKSSDHIILVNTFDHCFEESKNKFGENLEAIEKKVQAGNKNYTIVRCGFMLDNVKLFAPSISATNTIELPISPNVCLPFVSSEDLSRGIAEIMIKHLHYRKKTLILSHRKFHSFKEIAKLMSEKMEIPISYLECSAETFVQYIVGINKSVTEWQAQVIVEYFSYATRRDKKSQHPYDKVVQPLIFSFGTLDSPENWVNRHCKFQSKNANSKHSNNSKKTQNSETD